MRNSVLDNLSKYQITETLNLEYCWVFGTTEGLHQHHIIPRGYGGESGPTVTLSASCHDLVHSTASSVYVKYIKQTTLSPFEVVRGHVIDNHLFKNIHSTEQQWKIMYLVILIIQSRQLSEGHNLYKTTKFNTEFSQDINRKVDEIKNALGLSSKQEVVKKAVTELHARIFVKR